VSIAINSHGSEYALHGQFASIDEKQKYRARPRSEETFNDNHLGK
jgi:hypothetical protein